MWELFMIIPSSDKMIAGFYFPLRLQGIPIDIHKGIVNNAA